MSFNLKINAEWNIILQVKQLLVNDPDLKKYGVDFLEAVQIASIELLENALKYSDPVKVSDSLYHPNSIIFSLSRYLLSFFARLKKCLILKVNSLK